MNEVKIFKSPLFGQVRIVTDRGGEPLFCLGDICKALSLRTGDVKSRLDKGVVSPQPLTIRKTNNILVKIIIFAPTNLIKRQNKK